MGDYRVTPAHAGLGFGPVNGGDRTAAAAAAGGGGGGGGGPPYDGAGGSGGGGVGRGAGRRRGASFFFEDVAPQRNPSGSSGGDDEESGVGGLRRRKGGQAKKQHHANHLMLREQMERYESLDFKVVDNDPLRQHLVEVRGRLRWRNGTKTLTKWFVYALVGVLLGAVAFGLREGVDQLQAVKKWAVQHFMQEESVGLAFLAYLLINLVYAGLGTLTVCLFGHAAASSGIPEVKGFLNGVRVRHTINLKTFVGKIVSVLFSFSSCLALGPEGPMVHIGAMIGGGLIMGKSAVLNIRLFNFEELRNDRDQRDFIAAGAAGGITAAFGAPVGGVLFGLEEAATRWRREMTWRTFFGCMLAAMTVELFSGLADQETKGVRDYGLLKFGVSSREFVYQSFELIPFIIIGIIGGILGAIFVKLNVMISQWRRDNIKGRKTYAVAEVMIVTFFTACLTFGIPALVNTCLPVAQITPLPAVCEADGQQTSVEPDTLFCEGSMGSSYNDLVNLFMLPAEDVLRRLFSRTLNYFTLPAMAVYLVVYFVLVTVTAGLFVAGGLFVPMMLVGATYGRMVGEVMRMLLTSKDIDPSVYALVGSTAMMAGFSRITISLCVIVMELTETTQYLLPIMLSVQAAKWVGDALSPSLYDDLMEVKSIPFLEFHTPPHTWLASVQRFMTRDVVCVREVERVDRIVEILRHTNHSGFPVIRVRHGHHRIWRGWITRLQLALLVDTDTGMCDAIDEDAAADYAAKHDAGLQSSGVPGASELLNTLGDDGTIDGISPGAGGGRYGVFRPRSSTSGSYRGGTASSGGGGGTTSGTEGGNMSAAGGGIFSEESESEQPGNDTFSKQRFRKRMMSFDTYRWMMQNWGWSGDVADLNLTNCAVQRRLFVDLRPYLDRSYVVVQSSFSFTHAYNLFQHVEQRALPVVDSHNRVCGVLTRVDFLRWHFEDTNEGDYDDHEDDSDDERGHSHLH